MSENKPKYTQNTTNVSLIATIIVAVLAIVLAVVAIITMRNSSDTPATSSVVSNTDFRPTQELVDECTYAAHDLVADSYSIIRLFVSEGLPHYDEPYGNKPEDGLYTVNSTEYTSLEDIENLVRRVYTNAEAERILGMKVYQNRKILVDIVYDDSTAESTSEAETAEPRPLYEEKTVLGISEEFTPNESYNKGWDSCSIAVLPKSETECELTIYLGGIATSETGSAETAEADPDSVLETAMVKIDGEWKLAAFVY